jgi:hypothetical protein
MTKAVSHEENLHNASHSAKEIDKKMFAASFGNIKAKHTGQPHRPSYLQH